MKNEQDHAEDAEVSCQEQSNLLRGEVAGTSDAELSNAGTAVPPSTDNSTEPESSRPIQLGSTESYYKDLHALCGDILKKSFESDSTGLQAINHNFIADFEKWIDVLGQRPECELLKAGLREYQFALLALVQGQYRQAFMALRLFLELTLGAVFFSSNELQLRVWLRGRRDVYWKPLISDEEGVLSKFFVDAFFDGLGEEAATYRAIAKQLYRECSEYVHGNVSTQQALPENLQYMELVFADWHSKAKSARLVITFALTARYLRDLQLSDRNKMEAIIMDELGHLAIIRSIFSE